MVEKLESKTQKTQSNEETIGYHKGSLSTLLKEKQELLRLLQIVDSLVLAHAEALKKLGIDVTKNPPKPE